MFLRFLDIKHEIELLTSHINAVNVIVVLEISNYFEEPKIFNS